MKLSLIPILLGLCFSLQAQNPCAITELTVTTGDCHPDTTYSATINFQVTNTTNALFDVWTNGVYYGNFPLSALPLTIAHFPYNGGANDVVKVCINDNADCCKTKEFPVPACITTPPQPCEVYNLSVVTGDCHGDSTYTAIINFQVQNAPGTEFALFANGTLFGYYTLSALPLTIEHFPYNGGANDVVKVCVNNAGCCRQLEFPVPACLSTTAPCLVSELTVTTGDCHPDTTYSATINFQVTNTTNALFDVWTNGVYYGNFALSALPLTIAHFPYNGGANDVVKVCINDNADCCKTKEFPVPACITTPPQPCEVYNLSVVTGDCHGDSTYTAIINFQVQNAPGTEFALFANGTLFGYYTLSALPLTIEHFPYNGGANDVVKVCVNNAGCCRQLEFPVPDCFDAPTPCAITELSVTTGDCINDSTYTAVINFQVSNTTNSLFDVWTNGVYYGNFALSALPLTIEHFPYDGGVFDIVKVCINDNAGCCKARDFQVPACLTPNTPCAISELSVVTGNCYPDSTYTVILNFDVSGTTNSLFDVWTNGVYYGNFPLSALPLTITHFPYNGGANDVVKVCINDNPDCCKVKEFPVPECFNTSNPCVITDFTVATGDCHNDSTYTAIINFSVTNTTNNLFDVWTNGIYYGSFPLSALPLTIEHFPYNGGAFDVVKVCINDNSGCCKLLEFPVPDCFNQPANCNIYDLNVVTTPCLCGQFFAILNFQHTGASNGSFDVVGNGVNYGNFPYTHSQPLILGPLQGNQGTAFEFVVKDHQHPVCHDVYELGVISCPVSSTDDAGSLTGSLSVSPNPATEWLTVSVQGATHIVSGAGNLEIWGTDGRRVKAITVSNAAAFSVSVNDLAAGAYQLVLNTDGGRFRGNFIKM